jgi:hypothetical protein
MSEQESPKEVDVKKALLLTALLAALVAASPAQGKELLGAQLCGADGCATNRDGTLREGPGGPFQGAGEVVAPSAPAGWLRGSLLMGDGGKVYGRLSFFYIPSDDMVLQPGDGAQAPAWWHPQGRFGEILRSLAKDVKPLPAPKLTKVTVNGVPVQDPTSYLRLYSIGAKATTYPRDPASVQVVFESARQSPWSAGNYLVVYPKSNLLIRDGQIVSIPRSVAEQVAAREGITLPGEGFPWLPLLAALLATVLLAATVSRFRPRPRPQPVPQA